MKYLEVISKEAEAARTILKDKGVSIRHSNFSADSETTDKKIWAPSQAMTKFQMEQAMGDWAENCVASAINVNGEYKAIPFGDNDKTLSQDQSFADLYRAGKMREMEFGKRSDLLLFKSSVDTPGDASKLSGLEAEELCKSCEAALEIRSSRTSAQRFVEYNQKLVKEGKKPARMEPSYTVKVEDLGKVYRWIARNDKPLVYVQVFFDSIYALNFLEVFRYINEKGKKLKLENPARSGKFTIMIPISIGRHIGTVTPPDFETVHEPHENGRHDIYARPHGGKATIDISELVKAIGPLTR